MNKWTNSHCHYSKPCNQVEIKNVAVYVNLKCEGCVMKIHSSFFENVKTKSFKMDKSTMDITLHTRK